MIDDMYAVMRRIHEIQSRFGLVRRRRAEPQAPQQPAQMQGPLQGQGFTGASPRGTSEVERAIDYIIGGTVSPPATGNSIGRGIQGVLGGGTGGEGAFLRTLMGNIRGEEESGSE